MITKLFTNIIRSAFMFLLFILIPILASTTVVPCEPLRKLKGKQELVATDKDHFSIMLRGAWGNRPYKP